MRPPGGCHRCLLGLFVCHRQKSEEKRLPGGIVVIALAVILAVVSYLLDSDVEKVVKRTYGS